MLSSVLNSKTAIAVNMKIIDFFVDYRNIMPKYKNVAYAIAELEKASLTYSENFRHVFDMQARIIRSMPDKKIIEKMAQDLKRLEYEITQLKNKKGR